MSLLTATRVAQKMMVAKFRISFDDTMVDTLGVEYALGANTASDIIANAKIFKIINLPVNSVVIGGFVETVTAFDTAGYDIILGDGTDADHYMVSVDAKSVGVNDFDGVGLGEKNVNGTNVYMSAQSDDACTAGEAVVVVHYIIEDRAEEVNPN